MDFKVSSSFVQGERIRIMEALTLALTLSEAKFNHYLFESTAYSMTLSVFTDSAAESKEVDSFVRRFLSPVWNHRLSRGSISSGYYWCDYYEYVFIKEEG